MSTPLPPAATLFEHRHIGPSTHEAAQMLAAIGVDSLSTLIAQTVPPPGLHCSGHRSRVSTTAPAFSATQELLKV